jgi:large subunit ribosomal protein L28
MSRVCQVTGKKPSVGCSVSHSNRKTLRRYLPNLQKKRVFNPATGKVEMMRISTNGMRTILKMKRVKKPAKKKD